MVSPAQQPYRSGIPAKPVTYGGVTFRSTLEARWAFFFDSLGIRWEYEPGMLSLPGVGPYLPDFWLVAISSWIEIKPSAPTMPEIQKAEGLAAYTRKSVYLFPGTPGTPGRRWRYESSRGLVVHTDGWTWGMGPADWEPMISYGQDDPDLDKIIRRVLGRHFPNP